METSAQTFRYLNSIDCAKNITRKSHTGTTNTTEVNNPSERGSEKERGKEYYWEIRWNIRYQAYESDLDLKSREEYSVGKSKWHKESPR